MEKIIKHGNEHPTQPSSAERAAARPLPFLQNGIIQVCQVVKDLDRAVRGYWDLFGIGPWLLYTYRKPLLKQLDYHGRPVESRFRVGLCWIGPLCIELVEQVDGNSIYADFVRDHGYGLHHLGVKVEEMEAAIAQARAAGLSILQEGSGHGADGSGHFAYLSTEAEIGTIIELMELPKVRAAPDGVYPPEDEHGGGAA
jgi:methylmalonyl-CoA/ethylmalonyl-CoA epimerase